MILQIFNNSSEPNKVQKEIEQLYDLTGTLRDGRATVQRPIIRIAGNYESNLAKMNYAYIPDFERYYYIDEIQLVRNSLYDLFLRVDVLMSFKDSFLPLTAYIESQEDEANLYLRNMRVPLVVQPIIEQIPIDMTFTPNNPSVILATVGKIGGD